jgi:hypothetical protein
MGGMSTYREINGTRWLVDDWRRAQATRLRELCGEFGRPVSPSELAESLGVEPRHVTHMALVKNGYALLRTIPGDSTARGLWPRAEVSVRLLEAVVHFRSLPPGTVLQWKEPRRTRARQFRARKLTISKTLRSRVQTSLRRARNHLGLRSLRDCRDEHLRLILDAVWTFEMERSLVPRTQWRTRTPVAVRARKTANNRRSEIMQFLSWAEWKGYLDLSCLARETLPHGWTTFISRVVGMADGGIDVAARRLAKIAYDRMQADSPERLVEIGFDEMEELLYADPRYRSKGSAKTTISRLRKAWNAAASADGHAPLPLWTGTPRVQRREDGGLLNSWWSAHAFMRGTTTLLDTPGMEYQLRQAKDMRDWWTLSDPTLRAESEGGPLPPRPQRSRQERGRKRLGARSEAETTAAKPLTIVSEMQRFALTLDEEERRLDPEQVTQMDWSELFADRGRVRRYIRYVFESSNQANGGKITAGVRKVWYVYTIMWSYLPAWLRVEIERIRNERLTLDISSDAGLRKAQQLEQERARHEHRIEQWLREADSVSSYIQELLEEYGGIVPRKNKTEIRESISHSLIRRMADALRDQRLMLAAERRRITRRYCILVTQEAMLRLHSILPWRPGTLRRAVIGVHIDPDTLEIAVRGRDDKVASDRMGVKWQQVRIPDLEWWSDPDEIEATVRVLRTLIDDVRPWLWANPTGTGRRLRRAGDDCRLMLSSYGIPWRNAGSYTTSFQAALQAGATLANELLAPGEAPITLPTGYGTTGSYIMRFLYGHRIRQNGGTYNDIASALGNSEATARRHYHDEHETETLGRLARQHRRSPVDAHPSATRTDAADVIRALRAAKAAFDADVADLDLSEDERAVLWQTRKAELLGA